jgi:predicted Rossmann-fold nucleotide-binding protein
MEKLLKVQQMPIIHNINKYQKEMINFINGQMIIKHIHN